MLFGNYTSLREDHWTVDTFALKKDRILLWLRISYLPALPVLSHSLGQKQKTMTAVQ